MSVSVQAIVGSETYNLSGRNPYAFISLTGQGLPPIRRIKERGPQQHGSTDVGFLLDERMLTLALLITGSTLADLDTYRDNLAEILKPLSSTPIKLRITRDDGAIRQIDCNTVGIVDFPNTLQERIGPSQMVIAQFEAADAIPYDPTLQNIVFDTSGGRGYAVPIEIDLAYTTGTSIDNIISLTYGGKWEVYPKIYVTGPAEDLVITNQTIDTVLDFTGHVIPALETYEIDLRYGFKTVTDSSGSRQNAALTDESDLATWRIVPSPMAPGGINDIRVEVADQATSATQVRVEFYNRYPNF